MHTVERCADTLQDFRVNDYGQVLQNFMLYDYAQVLQKNQIV